MLIICGGCFSEWRMSQDEEPVQLGSFFHVELWHEFMDAAGYADVDVLDHILSGMPIVGDITSSHRWASGRKPHPHSIEVDELRSRAWEFREKVLRAVRAVGDVSQLVGDDRWIPTQSVEVVQKNKVIGVDSATSRGISVAAVVMEKLELSSKENTAPLTMFQLGVISLLCALLFGYLRKSDGRVVLFACASFGEAGFRRPPARPAAFGEEDASCTLRQAPAVAFGSGELLLLSYCHAWPGIRVPFLIHSLVYIALPSEIAGGNSSLLSVKICMEFGEQNTAPLTMFQLAPVPSLGVINLPCEQLLGYLMAGVSSAHNSRADGPSNGGLLCLQGAVPTELSHRPQRTASKGASLAPAAATGYPKHNLAPGTRHAGTKSNGGLLCVPGVVPTELSCGTRA
ncbi:hypothetical protein AK812_SmicGene41039 [Symbiodinium microadriaticum]|uniref:Uncharacterized protein n=1 Tax=Symbiodinium microadriaticum TaxID=2951 RepID=A0A1Q9C754_SYMMI|nr:hypothetical protein AK812_SmicGene41039 [Symbiodinium microadriaticum]CAE7340581.1 unnamed protein product [Symbiodinium microadriaticum]CAE7364497.1 unnamed protein product [Symbiodinium sp. KB8]